MDPERPSYWDLLEEIARFQAQNARSFSAWAAAYRAAGEAAASTAETLETMAQLGRRAEAFWTQAPEATVSQALQLLTQPWQTMGVPFTGFPGTIASRFWEAWSRQSESGEGSGEGP